MVLTKHVYCPHPELFLDRLSRLQNEDFGRIKVPKFDFCMSGKTLKIEVEYIKGFPIGSASIYRHQIREDVVDRDSEWCFDDYHFSNFVIEMSSHGIYAVDLLSYRYFPDKAQRQSLWCQQTRPPSLKNLLHHEFF